MCSLIILTLTAGNEICYANTSKKLIGKYTVKIPNRQ